MQELTEEGMRVVLGLWSLSSMMGRGRGPAARLKENHTDLISYHCILHPSVLCAGLGPEFCCLDRERLTCRKHILFSEALGDMLCEKASTFMTELAGKCLY